MGGEAGKLRDLLIVAGKLKGEVVTVDETGSFGDQYHRCPA